MEELTNGAKHPPGIVYGGYAKLKLVKYLILYVLNFIDDTSKYIVFFIISWKWNVTGSLIIRHVAQFPV